VWIEKEEEKQIQRLFSQQRPVLTYILIFINKYIIYIFKTLLPITPPLSFFFLRKKKSKWGGEE
jgi:hypothetical protein